MSDATDHQLSSHPPVTDWTTDFDHAVDEYAARAPEIWDELRSAPGGALRALRRRVAADAPRRCRRHRLRHRALHLPLGRGDRGPPHRPRPRGIAPPISSDPPFHQGAPHAAARLLAQGGQRARALHRAYCNELLDAVAGAETFDAAVDYAQHIPVRVIAKMLGFPPEDGDIFRRIVHNALEAVDLPQEQRMMNFLTLDEYLRTQVQDHLDNPRDDLTSFLLNAEMDGEPLAPEHVGGTIALLLIAGIDTTWSAIGASLWHLAANPDDLARLVAEPALMPTAIEEFLRYYAPVTMARLVAEPVEIGGCPMQPDEWVLLPFPAANRDPEFFDRADEVVLDREVNRHAAFGLGIHRCAGSNLARMELRVALETFLERFPSFTLADPDAVRWSRGQVRGPRTLPVRITS
ncbi:MAG: cytochrome P450 [Acidimicrobiales bacterium]